MFRIDEAVVQQKMKDIQSEVEAERWKTRNRRAKKQQRPSFWIILMAILHLRKAK
ncbi:hypothetical protein [Planomicrobium sp. CPCC 101079]|uniref:hypothetical protein n=1 Tax=Planomicrobium sp. CPCC 101079 TaxID=2599618 RepID=UPI001648B882|nr:hypothetical protein [Planomicrobium sp. CPCC 101079]